jgi:hypothetical protein
MMSDNVRVLDSAFRPEAQLLEDIREVVGQYGGRVSYAQLLGIFEMLKFEYLKEGFTGDGSDE